jgi:predicted 3-demethylubiquinone-9 3-methyltransferase (glyoxalase superfamily)
VPTGQRITPCLWFETEALEAAEFYASVFPNSAVVSVLKAPADTPGPKAGSVLLVQFNLAGQEYQALNGGRHEAFNDAVSLSVSCEDQAEVDRLWSSLTADGGRPVACGWLKDKYGLSWQIVPRRLPELLADPDPNRAKRALEAMMTMVKIDVAALEAATEAR